MESEREREKVMWMWGHARGATRGALSLDQEALRNVLGGPKGTDTDIFSCL